MAQAYPLPRPLCQLPSLLGPPGNQVHAPRPPPQSLCCCHWLCWEQPFPGSFSPNPSLAPMSPLKTSPPTPSFPEQQLAHAHRASPARLVPHATLQSPSFLTGLFVHSQTPFTTADTNRPRVWTLSRALSITYCTGHHTAVTRQQSVKLVAKRLHDIRKTIYALRASVSTSVKWD